MHQTNVSCPACQKSVSLPFPSRCPYCAFNIDGLAGRGTSSFQTGKYLQHGDILQGRNIGLYGKQFNASFDYNGSASLDDLVRFALSFGDRATVQPRNRPYITDYVVAYVPEIIGSGTSVINTGPIPCSGVALISPASVDYSHSFPVIDTFVQSTFANHKGSCKSCGATVSFGFPFCGTCYLLYGDWRKLI